MWYIITHSQHKWLGGAWVGATQSFVDHGGFMFMYNGSP